MSTHQPALLDLQEPARPAAGMVAHVLVLTGLSHLDRPFDYRVPEQMRASVRPGVRVKVRFAGVDRDGFVLSCTQGSSVGRELAPLRRVVSDLPVLTPDVMALCRAVARRYAGTSTDVVRLAIPPRHAAAEKAALAQVASPEPEAGPGAESGRDAESGSGTESGSDIESGPETAPGPETESGSEAESGPDAHTDPLPDAARERISAAARDWAPYPGATAFLRRVEEGRSPRAVWTALPSGSEPLRWARLIAHAIRATVAGQRSALAVLPDLRDVQALGAALREAGVEHDVLSADQGPSARYRRFVGALTGQARVVIGTRSAAFAPLPDLGLVVCWDDGDDLLAEQRAPYPHARTVLAERARLSECAVLIGGYARTPAAHLMIESGWAHPLQAERAVVRRAAPRVRAPGETDLQAEGAAGRARIPQVAWRALRSGLERGPVLVQVPSAGYVPGVSCATCRAPARCTRCHGRLRLAGAGSAPSCGWCGRLAADFTCPHCQGDRVRAARVGSVRTAEELGRAFPGVPVLVSGRDGGVLSEVTDRPQLVIATPGAEPVAAGGYRAAALLDASVTTERPELDASVEALRRWMRAAALVRSAADSGEVVLVGMGAPVPTQALVRWDPAGLASRELAERRELDFPPVAHLVSLVGPGPAVRSLISILQLPDGAEVLGPVEAADPGHGAEPPPVRALVRSPREVATKVNESIVHAQALRSARKEPGSVRVQVDPIRLW